jgi:hypothetical protein
MESSHLHLGLPSGFFLLISPPKPFTHFLFPRGCHTLWPFNQKSRHCAATITTSVLLLLSSVRKDTDLPLLATNSVAWTRISQTDNLTKNWVTWTNFPQMKLNLFLKHLNSPPIEELSPPRRCYSGPLRCIHGNPPRAVHRRIIRTECAVQDALRKGAVCTYTFLTMVCTLHSTLCRNCR